MILYNHKIGDLRVFWEDFVKKRPDEPVIFGAGFKAAASVRLESLAPALRKCKMTNMRATGTKPLLLVLGLVSCVLFLSCNREGSMFNQLREDTACCPPISEVNKEEIVTHTFTVDLDKISPQETYLRGEKVYQRVNVPYRRISGEEAKQMMQNTDKYILLDVRTKEEYEIEHIEGTLLIPDYEIGSLAATELPDKNALILIYCRSGRRGANVAHELIKMGYTNVYDFGGIIDWQYETVRRETF